MSVFLAVVVVKDLLFCFFVPVLETLCMECKRRQLFPSEACFLSKKKMLWQNLREEYINNNIPSYQYQKDILQWKIDSRYGESITQLWYYQI